MKCPSAVVIHGKRIELVNCVPKKAEEWNIELARALAEANGIKFTDDVAKIVKYVRKFWLQYGTCPPISVVESDMGVDRRIILAMFGGRYDVICILAGAEPPTGCLSQVLSST